MSSRQKVEASLRQLEKERALLQHQSSENLRKVEIESDRKRSLENEREHRGEIADADSVQALDLFKCIRNISRKGSYMRGISSCILDPLHVSHRLEQ